MTDTIFNCNGTKKEVELSFQTILNIAENQTIKYFKNTP